MQATIIGIITLSLSFTAHAGKPKPPEQSRQEQHQDQIARGGDATSSSESASNARAAAESSSVAENQTDVDASSDVAVVVDAGDTTVRVDGDTVTYDFPSNTSYAPPAFSNIKCGEVIGFGYTNLNGSGSLGLPVPRWLSRKIRDCEADADANWLAEMGMRLAAIEARCGTKSMQTRFGGNMRGAKNKTQACRTHLVNLLRDQAELDGLRSAVKALSNENQTLTHELTLANDGRNQCDEAQRRTAAAWKGCLRK